MTDGELQGRKKKRRWNQRGVLMGVVGGLAAVVFGACLLVVSLPRSKAPSAWAVESGKPVPRDFLYAMFPVSATVALCDAPGGTRTGVLGRVVVNTEEEVAAGGWVRVREGDAGGGWAELKELAYLPRAESAGADAFEAFKGVYKARKPGEYRDARWKVEAGANGTKMVTLRLRQEDHWQEYVYEVGADGKARAVAMYLEFGLGR